MAITADFGGVKYENITGYRIACGYETRSGIQESFYVYIEQVISPQTKFSALDMGVPAQGTKRGNLSLKDNFGEIDYHFSEIDLIQYQIHFSHYRKVRLLTFRYDKKVTDAGQFCTLNNNQQSKAADEFRNQFAADYQYSIQGQGFSESLLSVSSKFERREKEYIRLGTVRNKQNSFMKLALELDSEKTGFTPRTVTYKGIQTTIDRQRLQALIVDETYGSFLKYGLPNLDVVAKSTSYGDLLAIEYNPLTPFQYLEHAETPPTKALLTIP